MCRKKWHIILLDDITPGGVKKINFKLPANVKHCMGFMFSASVPAAAIKNYAIGNLSFFINNKKYHPLHYTLHSKPLSDFNRKNELLSLHECIEGGSFVQGYYQDFSGFATSYPYKLRIYLDCRIDNG